MYTGSRSSGEAHWPSGLGVCEEARSPQVSRKHTNFCIGVGWEHQDSGAVTRMITWGMGGSMDPGWG